MRNKKLERTVDIARTHKKKGRHKIQLPLGRNYACNSIRRFSRHLPTLRKKKFVKNKLVELASGKVYETKIWINSFSLLSKKKVNLPARARLLEVCYDFENDEIFSTQFS